MDRKAGDWNCRSCQHLNFSRRDSCQCCGLARCGDDYISEPSFMIAGGGSIVKPGDWFCCSCGVHNYASRPNCFKCGAFKDHHYASAVATDGFNGSCAFGFDNGGGGGGGRAGWKSGDWMCTRPGCNEHNYASRKECYRCNAPRI